MTARSAAYAAGVEDQPDAQILSGFRRAKDLVATGHKRMALDALYQTISNRRLRTWTPKHEELMRLAMDLCVDMNTGMAARDYLKEYRNITIHSQLGSLGEIVRYFLDKAEEKADKAVSVAANAPEDQSIEAQILNTVAAESAKARAKRRVVDPAVNFAMDCVNSAQINLRNDVRLEELYQMVLQRGLDFVRKYSRPDKLGMLRENQSKHLRQIFESTDEIRRSNFTNSAAIFEKVLQSRFKQLEVAHALNDWSMAYKTIDDVDTVFTLFKRPVKQSYLVPYYEQLSAIFWHCNNTVFHSHCLIRIIRYRLRDPQFTGADRQTLASQAILSMLCIPTWQSQSATQTSALVPNHFREKAIFLAKHLGLSSPPSHASLTADIYRRESDGKSIVTMASPEVQKVLEILRDDSSLNVCHAVRPHIDVISQHPTLAQYCTPLKTTVLARLVGVISQAYSSITIQRLIELCGWYDKKDFVDVVEPLLADITSSRSTDSRVVLDLVNDTILFRNVKAQNMCAEPTNFARQLRDAARPLVTCDGAKAEPLLTGDALQAAIAADRQRIVIRTRLANLRIDKAEERVRAARNAEQARIQEANERQRKIEEDRLVEHRKQLEKEFDAKVAAEEDKERRKWIVKLLSLRYPGLNIADLAKEEKMTRFQEKLHEKLLEHRRMKEKEKNEEERRMNDFERACREVEIPKRRELELETKEQQLEESRLRAENLRLQHRKNYDESMAAKNLVSGILKYKTEFEQAVWRERERAMREKNKKREEEEAALEAEKQRRRQDVEEAEAEIARRVEAKAAAAAAAAAAPTTSPTPESTGAYRPPSKAGAASNEGSKATSPTASGAPKFQAAGSTPPPDGGEGKPAKYVPGAMRKK